MGTFVRAKKNSESSNNQQAASCSASSRGFKASTPDRMAVDSYANEPLVLSERDSEFFLSVMENPPEPSEGLLSVFE